MKEKLMPERGNTRLLRGVQAASGFCEQAKANRVEVRTVIGTWTETCSDAVESNSLQPKTGDCPTHFEERVCLWRKLTGFRHPQQTALRPSFWARRALPNDSPIETL